MFIPHCKSEPPHSQETEVSNFRYDSSVANKQHHNPFHPSRPFIAYRGLTQAVFLHLRLRHATLNISKNNLWHNSAVCLMLPHS